MMGTMSKSKGDCRTAHQKQCAKRRQSGIAPVTQVQLTRTKYNEQEIVMYMLYLQDTTLPKSLVRKEEAQKRLCQAPLHPC